MYLWQEDNTDGEWRNVIVHGYLFAIYAIQVFFNGIVNYRSCGHTPRPFSSIAAVHVF
jgi:hypothetical protein